MNEICEKITEMIPYSANHKSEWDNFIFNESINGTFIHCRDFFDHDPQNAQDDASLVFYKETKIVAAFPATFYLKNDLRILHSHLRATYGGFIVNEKVGVQEAINIVQQTIVFAKKKEVNQIIVRNPFRVFHSSFCDETDYAMWFNGFRIKSRELEIVIPLFQDFSDNRNMYHNNTSRNVKKASKLVEVRISDDFIDFWKLLGECLSERHGQKPVHNYNSIYQLRQNVGKEKVLLFNAYYQGCLIGGIVLFLLNKSVAQTQYIASDYNFKHLFPVHAIIDFLISWCSKRGLKYLNLGMANEEEGRKINFGLFHFKESFGGRGMLRETMVLDL